MHLVNCSNYKSAARDRYAGGSVSRAYDLGELKRHWRAEAIQQPHGQVLARGGTTNTWR